MIVKRNNKAMNRAKEKESLQEFLDYLSNNEVADIGHIQIDLFLDWKYGEAKTEIICDHNATDCKFHTPKTHICYFPHECTYQQKK